MWYWVGLTISAVVMSALVVFAIVGLLEVLRPWDEVVPSDRSSSATTAPDGSVPPGAPDGAVF